MLLANPLTRIAWRDLTPLPNQTSNAEVVAQAYGKSIAEPLTEPTMMIRSNCVYAIALVALAFADQAPGQQPYPLKPVRVITPSAAGTGPDTGLRLFGKAFSSQTGQPLLIDNQPAAGGALALQAAAKAPADGYTLLFGNNGQLAFKHMQPNASHDLAEDYLPITRLAAVPALLVVRPDFPAARAEDLLSQVKAAPGRFNYGGTIGTPSHLSTAMFLAVAGLSAVHVPDRGNEMIPALLRGDTHFGVVTLVTSLPLVKSGKLRALAVSSATRLPELPEVPTLHERLKSELLVLESWGGLFAPAKTPLEIANRIYLIAVKAADDVRREGTDSGMGATSESPEAFAQFVRRENDKARQMVKVSGAKAQ